MKKRIYVSLAIALTFAITLWTIEAISGTNGNGWFAAGSKPKSYDMGVTSQEHHSGSKCAYIKSKESEIDGFGTYMQTSVPGDLLGRNVRMTGWIKANNVKDWAGMWLRVDGESSKDMLAFDNMQDRPITGTTDWKKCEIVLDVPKGAKDIAYGVLLSGTGEIYFDDVSFENLGPATGKTGTPEPSKPSNLDFEQ
jgi:hypothetical protein